MRAAIAGLGLLLLLPETSTDADEALDKAVEYVRKNVKRDRYPGKIYAGFLFMLLPDSEKELDEAVSAAIKSLKTRLPNRNWYMSMSLYFLSEYYLRHHKPEVAEAMTGILDYAAEHQEETGGWCHYKGMWRKHNYHKQGGGKDLAMVTTLMYGAFWNMKAAGLDVPDEMMERVEKNLDSIPSGPGFSYGTGNRHGDFALSRGANVLLGLMNAGQKEHKYYAGIAEGLPDRYKNLEKCHSFAPLHHFPVALALHRLGKYDGFAEHWVDKLTARQKPDGSVHLEHDSGRRKNYDKTFGSTVGNTAVFAIILLLREEGMFPAHDGSRAGGRKRAGSNNPFGRNGASKPEPPAAPKEEPSKKRGFGRRFP